MANYHLHPCEECCQVYTCKPGCAGKETNGRCQKCDTGHPRPVWDTARDPVTCCRTSCRVMTQKEVTAAGNLAGTRTWYRCRTCARSHPFNPARPT